MTLAETITGQDARLLVRGGGSGETEVTISNVSLDIEASTTDVQHNDDLNPKIVTTGMRYSGSFEYEGVDLDVFDQLIDSFSDDIIDKTTSNATISLREESSDLSGSSSSDFDRNILIKGVNFTNISRDVPGDDVVSLSVDFEAERVKVFDGQ